MKICPKCHAEYDDGVMFCKNCGEKLENNVKTANEAKEETVPISGKRKCNLLSKENLFSTVGRRGRKDYFLIGLFWGIVFAVVGMIFSALHIPDKIGDSIVTICSLYPAYCNNVMRLHDLNKDKTWAIVLLVAGLFSNVSLLFIGSVGASAIFLFICVLVGLYMLFVKGTDGPNQYGEDPLK